MREIHLKKPKVLRLSKYMTAPLTAEEVKQLEALAKGDGFTSAARWAACKLRELIEQGAANDGGGELRFAGVGDMKQSGPLLSKPARQVEQGTVVGRSPHPNNGSAGVVASTNGPAPHSPALNRSWGDLTDEERVKLAPMYMKHTPLPAGFARWKDEAKLLWLDHEWPLGTDQPKEEMEF